MEDVDGHIWYLQYPLTDGLGPVVTVATTRPETMLGDTAVAVNPADPRAEALQGQTVTLPIVGRVIPIIADDYVVMPDPDGDAKARIATGFLKVTPAHDPNDYEIGLRHDLPVINVMAPDGSISDQYGWDDEIGEAGPLIGLESGGGPGRCRGLVRRARPARGRRGPSPLGGPQLPQSRPDRAVPVRSVVRRGHRRPSAGRSVAGDDARSAAGHHARRRHPGRRSRAATASSSSTPTGTARTFVSWHENIRDWCISRQLWWGHRIPVWTRTIPLADATPDVADAPAGARGRRGDPRFRVQLEPARWRPCCPPPARRHVRRERLRAGAGHAGSGGPGSVRGRPDRRARSRRVRAGPRRARHLVLLGALAAAPPWAGPTPAASTPSSTPPVCSTRYVPTRSCCTARDIITLWVSRMVMFGRYFRDGALPFRDVFIHVMIQDGHGQRMSKSLGNGVDPATSSTRTARTPCGSRWRRCPRRPRTCACRSR